LGISLNHLSLIRQGRLLVTTRYIIFRSPKLDMRNEKLAGVGQKDKRPSIGKVGQYSGGRWVRSSPVIAFNEKIPVLMVPPEHRETVRPVLEKLSCLV
jgi:hypothetical protein